MATSQMGRGLTLKSYEGLRPAFPSKPSMASSSVSLRRFSCTTLSVRAATSVASKFSTLKPLGDRVLIKLKQAEEKTQGGILLPPTSQKKPEGGEVVALGDAKTVGKTQIPLSVPLGANIVYSKWAGTEIEFNGVNHLLVKEDDIVGVLDTDDIKDLKPLNDRVLIKVAVAEEKTAGGLLLTESAKEKPSIGTIIAVGPGAYDEEGKRKPMSVTAGNTVLYSKFAEKDLGAARQILSMEIFRDRSNGGAISWMSKLQNIVALSNIEAEYIAASHACKEAIWLKGLFGEFGRL